MLHFGRPFADCIKYRKTKNEDKKRFGFRLRMTLMKINQRVIKLLQIELGQLLWPSWNLFWK